MGSEVVQSLRVRMNLVVMAMKVYFTLLKAPELEPYDWIHFRLISRTPFWLDGDCGESVVCAFEVPLIRLPI